MLTLIVSPRLPELGAAVASVNSVKTGLRLVPKADLTSADVILAQTGLAFFLLDCKETALPHRFGASFRSAVLICNTAKMDLESTCQLQMTLEHKVLVVPAHGLEEAAEFIVRHASAMADQARRGAARNWVFAGSNASKTGPRAFAQRVADALPIASDQAQILLESCGSLAAIASLGSAQGIMDKTPLSNADAKHVAEAMFLTPNDQGDTMT